MATSVAELVTRLHSNIDSIHKCIEALSSTDQHDAEMERLEREREELIEGIRRKYEAEAAEAEERRKTEAEELLMMRKREEDEIAERRRREDEARQAKIEVEERGRVQSKEEEQIQREHQAEFKRKEIQEQIEKELERLENEMERRVEEGKKQLVELDERRKAINAQIDAALNIPLVIPTVKFRSRAKTVRKDKIPAVSDVTLVAKSNDAEADIASSEAHGMSRGVAAPEVEVIPKETLETVDAEKAWWQAHHLKSKTQKPDKNPVPDVLNQEPDIQNSLSKRKVNIQAASVIAEAEQIQIEEYDSKSPPETETRSIHAEDPEDIRAREEIAMLNAELMRVAAEAEKEEQARSFEENDLHGDVPEVMDLEPEVPETAARKNALNPMSDVNKVYHFSEEDRPHPIFEGAPATTQVHHFSENSRPRPTFIYRFSESQRPSPEFNESNDAPKVYHFSEENRPYPGFTQREVSQVKPNLLPGTYRFSEQARPQPRFWKTPKCPRIIDSQSSSDPLLHSSTTSQRKADLSQSLLSKSTYPRPSTSQKKTVLAPTLEGDFLGMLR